MTNDFHKIFAVRTGFAGVFAKRLRRSTPLCVVQTVFLLAALSPIARGIQPSWLPQLLLPPAGEGCRIHLTLDELPSPNSEEAGTPKSPAFEFLVVPAIEAPPADTNRSRNGIQWSAVLHQSARFLSIQHGIRVATQDKTRSQLRGPYFADYVKSVRGLSGWGDGDSWKTNYVGHPMQGSISGYLLTQNDPNGRDEVFSRRSAYWKSRLRAMAFNAAYSTHYELSPIGEAGVGNVGMKPGTKGAVDLVITPTLGAAWMVTEDLLDARIIAPLERSIRHPVARLVMRSVFNPTRSFANLLRGAYPWHRDTRGGVR